MVNGGQSILYMYVPDVEYYFVNMIKYILLNNIYTKFNVALSSGVIAINIF